MKKLLVLITGISIISFSACQTNNIAPESQSAPEFYEFKLKNETIENTIDCFSFTFNDVLAAIDNTEIPYIILNEFQKDNFTVYGIEAGQAYSEANTHIYCFVETTTDKIIAVKIYCEDFPNHVAKSVYSNSIRSIVDLINFPEIKLDIFSNDAFESNGVIATSNISEKEFDEWGNTLFYIDKYDFSATEYHTATTPNSDVSTYPVVTYDDILTNTYNCENILIDAIVDKVSINNNSVDFALWYPSNQAYIYDTCSKDNIPENSTESTFLEIQSGDVIRYSTTINSDGSFGASRIYSVEIIDHQDIDNVHNQFKNTCLDFNYDTIVRNPDNYIDDYVKIYGTVFQIIEESDYSAEYLISTNSGYIYATWYDEKVQRGSRFLEGDAVALYGRFETLRTYDTLISQNTVPLVSVILMELN